MPDDEEKKSLVEKLKKELASLEWEEDILRKRDDRLKWEEEMLQMEEGLKAKGRPTMDKTQSSAPVTEPQKAPSEAPLDPGSTYLIPEQNPQRSVAIFLEELKAGMKGLFITRSNPNHVRKKHDLGDTKVCWLTGVRAGGEIMSVSGLQELSILISNFIDENPHSVILLDGVEYLISNNDFQIVLRLMQQLRDKVSTSESKMIIPVNPEALDGKQLTLLQRECHLIQ